jgi:hypothetical protein
MFELIQITHTHTHRERERERERERWRDGEMEKLIKLWWLMMQYPFIMAKVMKADEGRSVVLDHKNRAWSSYASGEIRMYNHSSFQVEKTLKASQPIKWSGARGEQIVLGCDSTIQLWDTTVWHRSRKAIACKELDGIAGSD